MRKTSRGRMRPTVRLPMTEMCGSVSWMKTCTRRMDVRTTTLFQENSVKSWGRYLDPVYDRCNKLLWIP